MLDVHKCISQELMFKISPEKGTRDLRLHVAQQKQMLITARHCFKKTRNAIVWDYLSMFGHILEIFEVKDKLGYFPG